MQKDKIAYKALMNKRLDLKKINKEGNKRFQSHNKCIIIRSRYNHP